MILKTAWIASHTESKPRASGDDPRHTRVGVVIEM